MQQVGIKITSSANPELDIRIGSSGDRLGLRYRLTKKHKQGHRTWGMAEPAHHGHRKSASIPTRFEPPITAFFDSKCLPQMSHTLCGSSGFQKRAPGTGESTVSEKRTPRRREHHF